MRAVRLLTGAMALCVNVFSIGLLLSHSLFCWGIPEIFRKFGIVFLVPYNKDFGRITQFCGNDVATVPFAAFCYNFAFK